MHDDGVPKNHMKFSTLMHHLLKIIKENKNEKIYMHCRGGHSRSSVLVCCLLGILENLSGEEAILKTTFTHHNRIKLKNKWKNVTTPQKKCQRSFVSKFLSSHVIGVNDHLHDGYVQIFKMPKFDHFASVKHACEHFIKMTNHKKIKNLLQTPDNFKQIILCNVTFYKSLCNPHITAKLLHTGFRNLECFDEKNDSMDTNLLSNLFKNVRSHLFDKLVKLEHVLNKPFHTKMLMHDDDEPYNVWNVGLQQLT